MASDVLTLEVMGQTGFHKKVLVKMNKKCPYCNDEMELGYIQSRDGVFWTDKIRNVAAFPPLGSSFLNLGSWDHGLLGFKGSIAEAYNCRKCKTILIDYGGTIL